MNNKNEAMKNAAKAPEGKETVTVAAKTVAAPVEEKKATETVKKTEAPKEEAAKKTEAPKEEAAKKAEAPKEEAVKKAEAPKEEAVKKAEAPKEEAAKKAEAPKEEAAKKAEPAKKAPVKKTEAPKKASAKKEEPEMNATVFVEYEGKQIAVKEILETAKNDYISKHEDAEVETIELYVKPEENAAYYVVNGEGCEEFKVLL